MWPFNRRKKNMDPERFGTCPKDCEHLLEPRNVKMMMHPARCLYCDARRLWTSVEVTIDAVIPAWEAFRCEGCPFIGKDK